MNAFSISKDYESFEYSSRSVHILKFLAEHPAGVLASVDPDGNPHATVIYYSADDDFAVRFLTKKGTKKSSNLQYNDRVALVVFDDISQTTAQLIGTVKEITDAKEVNKIFRSTLRASLRTSKTSVPPISKLQAGEYVAYLLTPVEVRMAAFSRAPAGTREQLFEIVEHPA